jgi:hypothetical protein
LCEIIEAALEDDAQKELEATVAARRELGPEHDEHLIAGFLERIDKEIDRRVEERVGQRQSHERNSLPHLPRPNLLHPPVLGPVVGVVAVAGIFGGVVGVIGALIALAVIFVAVSVSRR